MIAPIEETYKDVFVYQEREEKITPKEYLYRQLFLQGKVNSYWLLSTIGSLESGWYEGARNPRSSAKGIFQIIDGTWRFFDCEGSPLNGLNNVDCALKIYHANGIKDWCADREMVRRLGYEGIKC